MQGDKSRMMAGFQKMHTGEGWTNHRALIEDTQISPRHTDQDRGC